MTIRNDDEFKASLKWPLLFSKTATRTTVALSPFTVFDLAGQPGAGTLAVGNTANGIVYTKATAGFPSFPDAPAGKGWWLAMMDGQSSVAGQRDIYDFIFSTGAHAFNANQTLTAQPSIDDRLRVAPPHAVLTAFNAGDTITSGSAPIKAYVCTVGGVSGAASAPNTTGSAIVDGTCTWQYQGNGLNYANLEILVEEVAAGTGNQSVSVGYSTMADYGVTLTTTRSSGAQGIGAALIAGRCFRLPLQSGDKNIARLDSIIGTVATVGTFNVHLVRKITSHQAFNSPFSEVRGYDRTGLAYIPNNAALREVQTLGGNTSATLPVTLTLAQG